jgi:CRP-like cAMP-binding protein
VTTIEAFCGHLPLRNVPAGEVLLWEGQFTGRLFVLVDGEVEVRKADFLINVVSERGAVFGEMSALLGAPPMATVRATRPSTMYAIENGANFLQTNKDAAFFVAELLAQRLHRVTAYLVDLKRQFADENSHLGIVDEILESLLQEQKSEFTPGSDREPDE